MHEYDIDKASPVTRRCNGEEEEDANGSDDGDARIGLIVDNAVAVVVGLALDFDSDVDVGVNLDDLGTGIGIGLLRMARNGSRGIFTE